MLLIAALFVCNGSFGLHGGTVAAGLLGNAPSDPAEPPLRDRLPPKDSGVGPVSVSPIEEGGRVPCRVILINKSAFKKKDSRKGQGRLTLRVVNRNRSAGGSRSGSRSATTVLPLLDDRSAHKFQLEIGDAQPRILSAAHNGTKPFRDAGVFQAVHETGSGDLERRRVCVSLSARIAQQLRQFAFDVAFLGELLLETGYLQELASRVQPRVGGTDLREGRQLCIGSKRKENRQDAHGQICKSWQCHSRRAK